MKDEDLWNHTLEFYEDSRKQGFDHSLQLNLVKQIANSQYADFLYPSTSLFTLIISPKESYLERINFPSVAVRQIDKERFEVTYSPKQTQTHNILKRTCHYSEVWSYLESMILRLKLESKKID